MVTANVERKLNIVMVEPSGVLGAFQYAHNLANALGAAGHNVLMATGIGFETKDYPRNYEAVEAFDRFKPRPLRLLRLLQRVRSMRPDIVHIQGHSHPTSYLLIDKLLRSVSPAVTVMTAQDVVPKFRKPHHAWSLRRLYPKMQHIFLNAEQNKQFLLSSFPGVDPARLSVSPVPDLIDFLEASDTAPDLGIPAGRRVVLFFGNIEPRKGILVLIKAFTKVLEQVPDAYLLIAGPPFDDMRKYHDLVDQLGIQQHVGISDKYIPLEQIPGLFERVELLALPYLEGWNSGVIATAYAHGKPVIASDIGGFYEVVKNGDTGFLVPPADDAALADAIILTMTDADLHRRVSQGAKDFSNNTSWPALAEKTIAAYRNLLQT
jgi:glycosyltransferase involved in cell wall biosynthesis